ncbi:hypothetical protein [Arthrobacter sp. ISL-30]|nr:hypothetical protein [Arthrobacter sp. ISL-30]
MALNPGEADATGPADPARKANGNLLRMGDAQDVPLDTRAALK